MGWPTRPKSEEYECYLLLLLWVCNRYVRWDQLWRVGENEDIGLGKVAEYRKAPLTATGLSFFRFDRSFSGRGSYSRRSGRRNEMTDNNAGRNAACMPCRDNSGGHSETWLATRSLERAGREPQDSVSALSTGPGLSRG